MAKSKMTNCKVCGANIARNAKVCPNCGAKNKKPIYKRIWFIILVIIILVSLIGALSSGSSSDSSDSNQSKEPEIKNYTKVDVSTLTNKLNENALKAQEEYKDQYLEISGKLEVIDSSGKYISLISSEDEFSFISVTCYIKNDNQRNQVANMATGDIVTLKGKCKDVGEVFGYYLDIDEIDGYNDSNTNEASNVNGYIVVDADTLADDIKANALQAQNKYKGNNLEVRGRLTNIDSSGKYINIEPLNDSFSLVNIQCYIKSDDIKKIVMNLTKGDTITVKGKCTDVGEVLGYSINIETIE